MANDDFDRTLVDFGQMDRSAGDFARQWQMLEGTLQNLEGDLDRLLGDWEGDARAAYYGARTQWDAASGRMAALLQRLGGVIEIGRENFAMTEKVNVTMFDGADPEADPEGEAGHGGAAASCRRGEPTGSRRCRDPSVTGRRGMPPPDQEPTGPVWPGLDKDRPTVELKRDRIKQLLKALEEDVELLEGSNEGSLQDMRALTNLTEAQFGTWDTAKDVARTTQKAHMKIGIVYQDTVAKYRAAINLLRVVAYNYEDAEQASTTNRTA